MSHFWDTNEKSNMPTGLKHIRAVKSRVKDYFSIISSVSSVMFSYITLLPLWALIPKAVYRHNSKWSKAEVHQQKCIIKPCSWVLWHTWPLSLLKVAWIYFRELYLALVQALFRSYHDSNWNSCWKLSSRTRSNHSALCITIFQTQIQYGTWRGRIAS